MISKKDVIFVLVLCLCPIALLLVSTTLFLFCGDAKLKSFISKEHIEAIVKACRTYAEEHSDQWPDNLESLVADEAFSSGYLRNPNRPDLEVGYIYIKPVIRLKELDKGQALLIIYESYKDWDKGITTNLGFISDEEDFRDLLRKATERRDPSKTRKP